MVVLKVLYWPTLLVTNHHAVRRFIRFSTIINQHEFHLQSILRSSYQFFWMIWVITLVFLLLVRCRFPVQLSIISVLRKWYGDTVIKQVFNFHGVLFLDILLACFQFFDYSEFSWKVFKSCAGKDFVRRKLKCITTLTRPKPFWDL